jgi:hypothetical protein
MTSLNAPFQSNHLTMRYIFICCFFFFLAGLCHGQRLLQLEKVNSPKTKKYFPGDEITFQIVGGEWYTRVIEDISYEQNLIVFAKGHMPVDSIVAFRTFDRQRWSRGIGNQLINFAVVWTVFSVIDAAVSKNDFVDEMNRPFVYTTLVVSTGLGLLIKKIFKKRTFNLAKNKDGEAKKWRLRVLDLEVKKPEVRP